MRSTVLYACALLCTVASRPAAAESIDVGGIPGGVCAVLGREDAGLALSVARKGRFVVHALFSDRTVLRDARRTIRAAGLYGTVSADISGCDQLPYAENIVNVLVADDYPALKARGLSLQEVRRVLCPLGAVLLGRGGTAAVEELRAAGFERARTDGRWARAVKPWPADIDQWTHYCHGPDGNPVAHDERVGPPKHYQWIVEPLWLRAHDSDSSVNSLVSAAGRIFYMVDEAPISLPGQHSLPDKWFVVGRDAFNGVLLWKRPVERWGWREWKETWFKCRPGVFPVSLNRRLVAVGDSVYVTLGYRAPVSRLDARTGKALQVYERTERTNEIICFRDRLVLSMNRPTGVKIACVDASTGRTVWETPPKYAGTTKDYIKFKAMRGAVKPTALDPAVNLAVDGDVVCLLDGRDLVCLSFADGTERWRAEVADEDGDVWMGSLIVHDDVVICATVKTLCTFSRASGDKLWTQSKRYLGHLWYEWKDVFVIGGLVWTYGPEVKKQGGKRRSLWPVAFNGYDPKTGEVRRTVPLGHIFTAPHHHRCYRNKATDRYILCSRRGTEFVDLIEGKHTVHNWLRGTCHMGMMPANGLHYATPHPCRCYINEKLPGFNAIASEIPGRRAARPAAPRLQRGPAYGRQGGPRAGAEDWPTYRHDPIRSGAAAVTLPERLRPLWDVEVGGKLTAPVVAAGKVFVSSVDEYHVLALDADDGSKLWEMAVGGRVDSPPTYYRGMLLFGCADGRVYCVGADDGALAWQFRAAPTDRLIGAFNRLESAWPVNGSVLVRGGVAYFAAGRSSFLDGGIYVYGVDASTGRPLHRARSQGPETDFSGAGAHFTYGAGSGTLLDILQADDQLVYLRDKAFDFELNPRKGGGDRVRPLGGFLDDTYFRRANWYYGAQANYGQLIVHDEDRPYIVRMFHNRRLLDPKNYFTPGKDGYRIIAGGAASRASQIAVGKSASLNPRDKAMTIEAWVKASSPDGAILACGGVNAGYALVLKGGRPRLVLRIKDAAHGVTATRGVVGRWAHVAGVLTSDRKLHVYVDGELSASGRTPQLLPGPPGQAMEIGADAGTGAGEYESPYTFGGIIDEVRLYYRALGPDELRGHVEKPGRAPRDDEGLALYFSFDEGNALDESGHGNDGTVSGASPVAGKAGRAMRFFGGPGGAGWQKDVMIRVKAMVAAGGQLIAAGPPDVMGTEDPLGAFEGRKGGVMAAFSASEGTQIAEYRLDSPPVFNGMAAAGGRLYLVTRDGKVRCFGGE